MDRLSEAPGRYHETVSNAGVIPSGKKDGGRAISECRSSADSFWQFAAAIGSIALAINDRVEVPGWSVDSKFQNEDFLAIPCGGEEIAVSFDEALQRPTTSRRQWHRGKAAGQSGRGLQRGIRSICSGYDLEPVEEIG